MKKTLMALMLVAAGAAFAQTVKTLPPVAKDGGMTLMQAMEARASARNFNIGSVLTDQQLGDMLWCANGYNRKDMRTTPSACNAQAVDIYVFTEDGIWLYLPKEHSLKQVKGGDFRKATGKQPFVANAAANLVFVYDSNRFGPKPGETKWAVSDASFCSENVYLYCASAGLKTVVRGMFDGEGLAKLLELPKSQSVVLTQSVGK